MNMSDDQKFDNQSTIPLFQKTWELDVEEGGDINQLIATHTEPFAEPLIEVPSDLKHSLAVTSVDALLNWGRKSAVWPLPFGPACVAFDMVASARSRVDLPPCAVVVFPPLGTL